MSTTTAAPDLWSEVVGQDAAVSLLRSSAPAPVHAYLLLGQEGWGARALARAFAADVLSTGLDDAAAARVRSLVAEGNFADLVEFEPEGRGLRVGPKDKPEQREVEKLTRLAFRMPVEGDRKLIVVPRFHLAEPEAFSAMLKIVEEPPASTIWLLLADEPPPEMVTILSRSVVVRLEPVPTAAIAARLVDEGCERERAEQVANAAAGDVALARLLADDERLALRVEGWRRVPAELDGSGHPVWRLVGELRASMDDALAHVKARYDAAEAELAAQIEEQGLPKGRLRELEASHKRLLRRARTAELRLGLATLGAAYRDQLAGASSGRRRALIEALAAIDVAYEALAVRNANEALQLQALFLRLPPVR